MQKPAGPRRWTTASAVSSPTVPDRDAAVLSHHRSELRALVIGAGPAGSVSAANLARRGYHVDVFERRSQPTEAQAASNRSYPMLISERSLQALERAGLRPKFLEGTPFDGMVSLTRGMTVRFSTSSQHIVHRLQLGLQLIAAAQEAYPGQIHYHYSQQLDEVDFEGQQASFTSFDGREPQKHSYDLLIGADGANSRVRELMQAADPRMRSTAISKAKSTYKTFHDLPPLPEGCHFSEGFEAHQPGQHMYMALGKGKEAKVATVAMWKNTAGRMCGMAALNHWEQWGHTPDEMKASGLPIPEPWLRAIGKQFDEQDFNGFGRIVKCTRIYGHRTALVGDAAHAVTSVLGQGCNTALSTCTALDKAMAASNLDDPDKIDDALDHYNSVWLPEAHALQRLEFMSSMARQPADRVTSFPLQAWWVKGLMLASTLTSVGLNKLSPSRFPNAFGTIQELQDPSLPYSVLLQRVYMRATGFAVVAAAVMSGLGWVVNAQLLHGA
ncbi:hypothetical protein WJX84_006721 [Apatococcus fuscideae]|uniref:FAD-binding domain-containing protein n=1 Tax=Apatococcus fuscideae TaxID=2026836 RepID=A0AAW1TGF4_9CHLO